MIVIDGYQTEDFEGLLALYRNKRAYGGNFDPGRDQVDRLLATSVAGNLYIAKEDDNVVGSVMILDNPHTFWLLRFVVDPDRVDGQQIAESLWAKASWLANERGHRHVIVYANPDDLDLNQRYESLGFHKAENYRCYWKETTQ